MPIYKWLQFGLVGMEAIAFITGLLYWNKVKNTYWKWFVIYLGVIVLCETTGLLLLYSMKEAILSRNFYAYFVIPFEFVFFYWLYYEYNKKTQIRYWVMGGVVIYLMAFLVNVIFLPNAMFWLMPFSYLTGIIILLLLVIVFFIRLMSGSEILRFRQNMMFWVSLGVLIFYLVSSPYFGLRSMLYSKYRDIFWIYYYLQMGVNYVMYMFFCFAFIWGKPR